MFAHMLYIKSFAGSLFIHGVCINEKRVSADLITVVVLRVVFLFFVCLLLALFFYPFFPVPRGKTGKKHLISLCAYSISY